MSASDEELMRRIHRDLIDSYDEELEMELEDRTVAELRGEPPPAAHAERDKEARRRYFREFWALRDIDLEVGRGETLGIIGRNGAGKSTLLQMICGTLMPTSGELQVNGRVAALLELGAGFNPEFSGRENVFLGAALYGLSPSQIEERFDDIAAFADIGAFLEQPVKTYSSGMYVRLAFAVVAHVDADIRI